MYPSELCKRIWFHQICGIKESIAPNVALLLSPNFLGIREGVSGARVCSRYRSISLSYGDPNSVRRRGRCLSHTCPLLVWLGGGVAPSPPLHPRVLDMIFRDLLPSKLSMAALVFGPARPAVAALEFWVCWLSFRDLSVIRAHSPYPWDSLPFGPLCAWPFECSGPSTQHASRLVVSPARPA